MTGRLTALHTLGSVLALAIVPAKARGVECKESGDVIKESGVKFVADSSSPRERWFLTIREGDTPENSNVAKITLEWID